MARPNEAFLQAAIDYDSIKAQEKIEKQKQNLFTTAFCDKQLEARFQKFYLREHRSRIISITWVLLVLTLIFVVRIRLRHHNRTEEIVFHLLWVTLLLQLCLIAFFKLSSLVLHLVTLVSGMICHSLVAMGIAGSTESLLDFCNDQKCQVTTAAAEGFSVGLIHAFLLMILLAQLVRFEFFLTGVLFLDFVFVFYFTDIKPLPTNRAFLGIVVTFTTLGIITANRYLNNLFRHNYLLFVGTLKLSSEYLERVEAEQMHKRRVVGYIFHEIRNPINNIVLAVNTCLMCLGAVRPSPQLSRRQSSNDTATSTRHEECKELAEMVEIIHDSAIAASHVLDDALTLERLQAGNFVFAHNPFCFRDLIDSTLRTMRPQMSKAKLQVDTIVPYELHNACVIGDFKRLQQVLHNFLSNAVKFSKPLGRVVVRADVASCPFKFLGDIRTCSGTVSVVVSVSDTGPGIASEDQTKLFQPWSQIRAATMQNGGGTGLGLSLSKDFVERGHQGAIGVRSPGDLGSGSTFFFRIEFPLSSPERAIPSSPFMPRPNQQQQHLLGKTDSVVRFELLPLLPDFHGQATDTPTESILIVEPPPTTPQPQRVDEKVDAPETPKPPKNSEKPQSRVLVVEDSVVTSKLVAKALSKLGATVTAAFNGKEAVEIVQRETFELILMDKEMPVMDGYQATEAIRKLGVTVPIIGVTGNAMDDQRKAFIEMGATRVIPKPITQAQLAALVEEFSTSWA